MPNVKRASAANLRAGEFMKDCCCFGSLQCENNNIKIERYEIYRDDEVPVFWFAALLITSTWSWSSGGASELVFVGFVLSVEVVLFGNTDEPPWRIDIPHDKK